VHHPDTRELMTLVLEERGADVTAVASAEETLIALGRTKPHVIVSDITFECEDSYELMRRIRGPEAGGDDPTPAVAVTTLSGAQDRDRAFAAGLSAAPRYACRCRGLGPRRC
jgi:CheY-like chemotaxis protein